MAMILGSDRRTFVLPVALSWMVGATLLGVVALAMLVLVAPGVRSWAGALIALVVAGVFGRFETRYRDIDSMVAKAESLPAGACRPPAMVMVAWAIASLVWYAATAVLIIWIFGDGGLFAGGLAGFGLASALRARKARTFTDRTGSVLLVAVGRPRPFRGPRYFVRPADATTI